MANEYFSRLTPLWLKSLCLSMLVAGSSTQAMEDLTLAGEAGLKFLFWDVYQAQLFSPDGRFQFPETRPFALRLIYQRDFSTAQLVSETGKQWQAIGGQETAQQQAWLARLERVLPNVSAGDAITLHVDKAGHSHFYLNDSLLGSIEDPAFSEHFAAIWLSEATTRPAFRKALLPSS